MADPTTTPQPPESTGWRCAICHTPGQLGQQCEQCGAQVYRSEPTTTGGQTC